MIYLQMYTKEFFTDGFKQIIYKARRIISLLGKVGGQTNGHLNVEGFSGRYTEFFLQ